MVKRVIAFFLGIVLGVGLAMLIGWTLFPMDRQEITPASMRADYQAEYVRMVATTYQANGNLAQAESRLRVLDADASVPLVSLTEQWIREARSADLVMPLVELAAAMNATTPAMTAYSAGVER